jgi:hypothetical protein
MGAVGVAVVLAFIGQWPTHRHENNGDFRTSEPPLPEALLPALDGVGHAHDGRQ